MSLRMLTPFLLAVLLPACAAEVLGAPDDVEEENIAATSEDLSTSARPFQSIYLPASKEVLCVFGDASTYRGAAASSAQAHQVCGRRAVAAAPGSLRIGFTQNRLANGMCSTSLTVDGVARNTCVSACNSSIVQNPSGGTPQLIIIQFNFFSWEVTCYVSAFDFDCDVEEIP